MLDIHIAKSFDEAMHNERVVGLDFDVHAVFFNDRLGLVTDRPQLQRMTNYYSDCTFTGDDIQALLAEIDAVSKDLTATSPHQEWLKQFSDACHSAIASGDSLFVLCD